ncbi:flagellar hook-length control protein FliK [Mesorhizobium sp. L-8-3]|uniref:flagellar hook-length control protein FliK n=1 Tax=Mesorhizobium sp. L-8-3 TaxID=2744522 RepID=UPI0019274A89|nr:flagellar hook-length control protein FliK [Mesorhizobium sp. L-8-3]BCH23143.1 hypothetical protein MesoLjLb_29280 [Mesorhizobium sp. L-8-3]
MNVSSPAIEQHAPKATARNDRGTVSNGERGFGKLLKSMGGGQGGRGLSADRSETVRAPSAMKLRVAPDEALTDVPPPDGEMLVQPRTDEAAESEPPGDAPDADTVEDAEGLLPLLTMVEQRPANVAPVRNAEPLQDAFGKRPATQSRASVPEVERPVEGRQERTVTVLEPANADGAASRPAQAPFGKTLAANLGALATQPHDRPLPAQDVPVPRTGEPAISDVQPSVSERSENRQRGTVLSEAVARASQPREAGDKRAEAKTAIADPKPAAPVLQPTAVSAGAPIVEALAANPPSHAAAGAAHLPTQPASTGALQSLKIQLHPAELGMVTARLRISDGQLSVEVEVETSEAYNRLSGANEAIARALRSHGISVDQVVIQAPPAHGNSSARDSTSFADTSSQGAEHDLSGGSDFGQSNGSGHRNSGYDNGHDADRLSPTQSRGDGGPAHGVYI